MDYFIDILKIVYALVWQIFKCLASVTSLLNFNDDVYEMTSKATEKNRRKTLNLKKTYQKYNENLAIT